MKRYQCIKSVWAEPEFIYPEGGRILLFKRGGFYHEHMLDNYPELTDDLGNIHLVTKELLDNFKELPPIYDIPHDDAAYIDQETLKYPLMGIESDGMIMRSCAVAIVFILTVLALIFLS